MPNSDTEQVVKIIYNETTNQLESIIVPGPANPGGTDIDTQEVIKNVLDSGKVRIVLVQR